MSNYTQSTNFATKDALSSGDPLKIVRGTEINTEFTNIAVAVATKLDTTALAAPGPIGATTPSSINATDLNGGQLAGLRNKIINGNMLVNQRGATASAITGSTTYYLDRWVALTNNTPSGTLTIGQQSVAVSEATSSNACLRLAKTAGTYAGQLITAQAFESGTSWGLAGKTVTISFKARKGSSYTGAALPIVIVRTGTGSDQSAALMVSGSWTGAASTTVSLTGTLTTSMSAFSGTATIPASATQVGVVVISNYATTTTGSANDYLDITDVQLEVGPVATPFEQRPYGMELALCQRYFEVMPQSGTGSIQASIGTGQNTSTTGGSVPITFKVTKRATPGVTSSGSLRVSSAAGGDLSVTSTSFIGIGPEGAVISYVVASGLVQGYAALFGRRTNTTGEIQIDAEL